MKRSERARRELEASARRIEGQHIGRPLKGREPRIVVSVRVEPSVAQEVREMTGRPCGEMIEEMHALLKMARNGAEAQMILDYLIGLLRPEVLRV